MFVVSSKWWFRLAWAGQRQGGKGGARYLLSLAVALGLAVVPGRASAPDTLRLAVLSEGYTLRATVLKPQVPPAARLPAVVLLVGSGGNSSHRTNYQDFGRFFLEEGLLARGYAVVYFDKRGVGPSEGQWYETTFEQRALDARNVAQAVQQLSFVDTRHTFAIGHSQGGWIAQLAVARYPQVFAGGISMAGATFGVRQQLVNDYWNDFICQRGLGEERALRLARRRVRRDLAVVSVLGRRGGWKQLRIIKNFEPHAYLRELRQPFLLLFGENDKLVSPGWSMAALQAVFPQGIPANFTTHTAVGENHSFKRAPMCYRGKWEDIRYSEATRTLLVEWLQQYAGLPSAPGSSR